LSIATLLLSKGVERRILVSTWLDIEASELALILIFLC
jgi:hypothetical protein